MRALLSLSPMLSLLIAGAASAVTMDWTPIGNPNNPGDTKNTLYNTCGPYLIDPCGAVAYNYSIGTYDVTNAQYIEFLNAMAASDPLGLTTQKWERRLPVSTDMAASPAAGVRAATRTVRLLEERTCPSITRLGIPLRRDRRPGGEAHRLRVWRSVLCDGGAALGNLHRRGHTPIAKEGSD